MAQLFVCSCKHNSSWVASQIHACTNETHFIANLQDSIPTLASITKGNTTQLKLLQNVFYLCMDGSSQLPSWNYACMNTQILASTACREGVSDFKARQLACHLFPYFLLQSLPPFKFSKFLFIYSLFTFYCTIVPHLSTLNLETQHLYNLLMHVPCPLL